MLQISTTLNHNFSYNCWLHTRNSHDFNHQQHNHFAAPFRDHPGEPVPDENFWTLWCKGRLTEVDTSTIRLGATPSGLTSAHLHHPHHFYTGRMPFLPHNQQCQSTEGNYCIRIREKTLEFSSTLLPGLSPYLTWWYFKWTVIVQQETICDS